MLLAAAWQAGRELRRRRSEMRELRARTVELELDRDQKLRIAAAEGRCEDEGWRIRKDGSRFWASVVITALHDKDGNLLGFTKVARDITEGKRAREAFLLEVTNALVSSLDVRQLLAAIAACLRQVKPFDYATLAQLAGRPKAVRAVGTACATNPLPVVVPCHRVIKSDGSLGGYLGGIVAKATLLALETAA